MKFTQNTIDWLLPSPYPDRYAAWFWQNHGLYHLQRMVQSRDPLYQTAVDLMMRPSDVCRAYYCVRNLPWQGEKAAIRFFQHHDPEYLILLRACLATVDRKHKFELYEQLVLLKSHPDLAVLQHPGSERFDALDHRFTAD